MAATLIQIKTQPIMKDPCKLDHRSITRRHPHFLTAP